MTVKEYAEQQGTSVQTVYHLLQRYEKELSGHCTKEGRQLQMDDFAVSFLLEHRDKSKQHNKAKLIYTDSAELISAKEEHRNELMKLRIDYEEKLTAKDQLIAQKDQLISEKDQIILELQKQMTNLQGSQQRKSFWSRIFGKE